MQTPVVMIVFNRPEQARRVFDRVRAARPPKLLVICDGPRADRPADAIRVAQVRKIFDQDVDWPCEVVRDYAPQNLGCMDRIHSGLNHAFELFEEAIILEDDCLPDSSFFPYCDELLARYRGDTRVMNIAGTNFLAERYRLSTSYWFSGHPWTWGWATWRRAWQHNDFYFASWQARQAELRASFASRWERQYWISTFEQARQNLRATNTWDFQWNFSCRAQGGVSIVPANNLIENIGFGADSTHTATDMSHLVVKTQPLAFPLAHPKSIAIDRYADDLFTRIYAGCPITFRTNLKARVRLFADQMKGAN
jgi:hypothetical protein